MPCLIDPGTGGPIELDDLSEALATTRIEPEDDDGFAALGPLLARLGRNRAFLGELAIAELSARGSDDAVPRGVGYGPQVIQLRPSDGRFLLRANLWPAADDAVLRASGAEAFVYGFPHNHNFAFLTYGYLGPGYLSDDYAFDPAIVAGVPGEPARLDFLGRRRLEPGQVALYRAHRDVHVQHSPADFSVSLNILRHDPVQPWHDQYRFDIAGDRIAATLTTTGAEALVMLATQLGGNGTDIAAHLFRTHPCARMRVTAMIALAAAGEGGGAAQWYAEGARSPDRTVAAYAARWMTQAACTPSAVDASSRQSRWSG